MWGMEDKVVIVTGGGKGIGRAYAEAFAASEARVAIADIDQAATASLAAELQHKGHHVLVRKVDVSESESCRNLARDVWDEWQGIPSLIM